VDHVQAPVAFHRRRDQILHRAQRADVGLDECRAAAGLFDLRCRFAAGGRIYVSDHHPRPFSGEELRRSTPDSRGAASDDRNSAR
jgi:hypothetical protein